MQTAIADQLAKMPTLAPWEAKIHAFAELEPERFPSARRYFAYADRKEAETGRSYETTRDVARAGARCAAHDLVWAIRWARGTARIDAALASGRLYDHFAPEGARRTIATRQTVYPGSAIGVPVGPITADGQLPRGSDWLEARLDESDANAAERRAGNGPSWADPAQPSWREWHRERVA